MDEYRMPDERDLEELAGGTPEFDPEAVRARVLGRIAPVRRRPPLLRGLAVRHLPSTMLWLHSMQPTAAVPILPLTSLRTLNITFNNQPQNEVGFFMLHATKQASEYINR